MAVGADWPRGRTGERDRARDNAGSCRGARSCGVEVAKIHIQALDFPSPVTCTPEIDHSLRAVAHHPTGIDLGVTEGLGHGWKARHSRRERSVYAYLAVGQPPGEVAHHVAIPPHITETDTHRAEPVYFCLVIGDRRPARTNGSRNDANYSTAESGSSERSRNRAAVILFDGTLKVGLKPSDPNGRELPVVADLTTAHESVGVRSVGRG